ERDRLPIEAHGSRYTARASAPRPHRLLPPGGECEYDPDGPVDPHDGAAPGGAVGVGFGAGRSTADVRSCGSSGAAAPVTRGFVPVMFAPMPPRPIAAIQAPEYRPALRVGSAPRGRVIMPLVCPWRQGTTGRDVTTRLKFSQPERILGIEWLAPCLGMRHCTGLCPAGGSTGLSCVAHASGVKHTLDGVQHGAVLEELLD